MLADCFKHITTNSTIITPNRRLSAHLHQHYQIFQLDRLLSCWQTADILPFNSWINRLWHDYQTQNTADDCILLNSIQEQWLWEKVIATSNENKYLFNINETAERAKTASTLIHEWQLDIHHPNFASTTDCKAMQSWFLVFESTIKTHRWIDSTHLPQRIITLIKQKLIPLPSRLIVFGFNEYSPQFKQLLSTCEMAGCEIMLMDNYADPFLSTCAQLSLSDEENEITTMARFAKEKLAQNPVAKIGCVIPSLDKKRHRVAQLFSEVFSDQKHYHINWQNGPFNLSAGKPLSDYPLVHAALHFLELNHQTMPIEWWSTLLCSPFLGEADREQIKRAQLDKVLKQKNINRLSLDQLLALNNDSHLSLKKNCPLLFKRINQCLTFLNKKNEKLTHHAWARWFNGYLLTLGFPGEKSLASDEYQVMDSFLKLLLEFTSLSQVSEPVSFQSAYQSLKKIAKKSIFQIKTPDAPIQILGVLEAASLSFDYLWIAGMNDTTWPPPHEPHPFIPKFLQQQLGMPHATAEREFNYCDQLIKKFKSSAKQVIFSYAKTCDELETRASTFIQDIPEISIESLALPSYLSPSHLIYYSKTVEYLFDEKGPLHPLDQKIRGGVNVIKQQALCPFKAFSEWRLHAHELERPLPGLRPKERGIMIHKSLEIFWRHIQSHANLINMTHQEKEHQLNQSIEKAFTLLPAPITSAHQYTIFEKNRLKKLMFDWLQIEEKREAFQVLALEQVIDISLGPYHFSVRIDRIDQLSDNKKLIVDYKTGKNNETTQWFGDRPEEPQLPFYTLHEPEKIAGIAYAQLFKGDFHFKGISRHDTKIDGIKPISESKQTTALTWEEQLNQWRNTLIQLSHDFQQGIATIDPKHGKKTCEYCTLKPLCRINENTLDYT